MQPDEVAELLAPCSYEVRQLALEGTGKKARHIKFHDRERLSDPGVRTLIEEAAKRTPRG